MSSSTSSSVAASTSSSSSTGAPASYPPTNSVARAYNSLAARLSRDPVALAALGKLHRALADRFMCPGCALTVFELPDLPEDGSWPIDHTEECLQDELSG